MGGRSYSDLLFAQPSFWEGAARVLDLGNTLTEYNESLTPAQADAIALHSDARAVGEDMRAAVSQAEAEVREQRRRR